jgi:hypothetical protein
MNRFGRTAASAFIVYAMGSASLAAAGKHGAPAMHLLDGKLYVDDALVLGDFSVTRTGRGFLFFYIPEFGLVTVATAAFSGAESSGSVEGSSMRFSAHGKDFLIDASQSILNDEHSPVWVRVDTNYALETKSPMVGYGDDPATPYHWPRQVRHAD